MCNLINTVRLGSAQRGGLFLFLGESARNLLLPSRVPMANIIIPSFQASIKGDRIDFFY
jgi:hypothetical protein